MKYVITAGLMALACGGLHAQSLQEALGVKAPTDLRSYIFVSTKLSDTTLVALARDAERSGSTLVLNGYVHGGPSGMRDTTRRVHQINRACCRDREAHWEVNPLLFSRYEIKTVPAFVLAKGASTSSSDYTKIAGEMSLANALKFIAQESKNRDLVKGATTIYKRSFATP